MGTFLYYLLWPAVWFYAPLKTRVRAKILVGDEVLYVKNWFGPGTWQLPGGGLKIGETSVQTAVREVKEELGIELNNKDMTSYTKEPRLGNRKGLLLREHFVTFRLKKKPEITKNREITDWQWQSVK